MCFIGAPRPLHATSDINITSHSRQNDSNRGSFNAIITDIPVADTTPNYYASSAPPSYSTIVQNYNQLYITEPSDNNSVENYTADAGDANVNVATGSDSTCAERNSLPPSYGEVMVNLDKYVKGSDSDIQITNDPVDVGVDNVESIILTPPDN